MTPDRRRAAAALAAAALALLVTPGLAPAQTAAAPRPQVADAWARPTVAGQTAGGAFLTIRGGSAADRLLAASADVGASTELHSMRMDGDVMRMRRVEAIEVPAGQTVKLEPGGLHVMFIGLKSPLQAGQTFPLRLRFEKGGETTVDVVVQRAAPGTPGMAPAPKPAAEKHDHGHKH